MKQIIRSNTFETNSSSAHSLIIISKDTFEKWKLGDLYLSKYKWSNDITDEDFDLNIYGCTYEEYLQEVIYSAYTENSFWDYESMCLELSKEGIDPEDFNKWNKNPYPMELDDKIIIEVFGRDG